MLQWGALFCKSTPKACLFTKIFISFAPLYLYNKNNLQGKVYDTVINDLDNRELGIPTRYSNNNKFIFWMHSDNEDNNPILQILHLKQ